MLYAASLQILPRKIRVFLTCYTWNCYRFVQCIHHGCRVCVIYVPRMYIFCIWSFSKLPITPKYCILSSESQLLNFAIVQILYIIISQRVSLILAVSSCIKIYWFWSPGLCVEWEPCNCIFSSVVVAFTIGLTRAS